MIPRSHVGTVSRSTKEATVRLTAFSVQCVATLTTSREQRGVEGRRRLQEEDEAEVEETTEVPDEDVAEVTAADMTEMTEVKAPANLNPKRFGLKTKRRQSQDESELRGGTRPPFPG